MTDFKKVSEDEKGAAFKLLLKGPSPRDPPPTPTVLTSQRDPAAYQGEIDALTRRSKSAENAFLNVYKLDRKSVV